ncbi:unnamed protein product [Ambrosiozyma monospora]|uniref:Unnamed protein product n=1 Tax=Ambrosiozyma monospora TaxID=43982 RepID=A0A9W6YNE6_AMBMO|nr:unnamed protein product [Ambrosiozyma monospora]
MRKDSITTPTSQDSKAMAIMDCLVGKFTPFYFVITMGIGISAMVLHEFPIDCIRKGSKYVGIVYFFINIVAFCVIHILFFLRYMIWFHRYGDGQETFLKMIRNHQLSVFLGTEVMGSTTIINMIRVLEPGWYYFTYTLWVINCIFALLCAWVLVFVMLSNLCEFKLSDLIATIYLPVVTIMVAASSGSSINQTLTEYPTWQFANCIICYMLWCNALFMGCILFPVYFQKQYLTGLPTKANVFSTFIPVGILGQGSYGIVIAFNNFKEMLERGHYESFFLGINVSEPDKLRNFIASFLHLSSVLIALFLLSMGVCMTMLAIFSIISYGNPGVWVKSMWAATFPLGTMSTGFTALFTYTGLTGFQVMGTIYGTALILITTYCIIGTIVFEIPWKQMKEIIFESRDIEKMV